MVLFLSLTYSARPKWVTSCHWPIQLNLVFLFHNDLFVLRNGILAFYDNFLHFLNDCPLNLESLTKCPTGSFSLLTFSKKIRCAISF